MQTRSTFYSFREAAYLLHVHIVTNVITRSPGNTVRLRVAAALMAVLILLYGYTQLLEPIVQWDAMLSLWMQTWRSSALDQMMLYITMLADLALCMALLGCVSAWLLARGQWWLCLYSACAFFSTTLSVTLIKFLTQRARPTWSDSAVYFMSFPSGHTARSVFVLGLLSLWVSWGRSRHIKIYSLSMAALLCTLIGTSRIYLGAHWLSDVLAGATLGGLMLLCIDWHWQRADEESVNIGFALSTCIMLYASYYLLSIEEQRLLYAVPCY